MGGCNHNEVCIEGGHSLEGSVATYASTETFINQSLISVASKLLKQAEEADPTHYPRIYQPGQRTR